MKMTFLRTQLESFYNQDTFFFHIYSYVDISLLATLINLIIM